MVGSVLTGERERVKVLYDINRLITYVLVDGMVSRVLDIPIKSTVHCAYNLQAGNQRSVNG